MIFTSVKKYVFTLVIFSTLLAIIVVAFNWFINPFNITNSQTVNFINNDKVTNYERVFRILNLDIENTDLLVIGSSRAAVYDETLMKDYWKYEKFQNLSISSLRVKEFKDILEHIIENSNVENIIYIADFFAHNSIFPYERGYINGAIGRDGNWKLWSVGLFSLTAIKESIITLRRSLIQKNDNQKSKNRNSREIVKKNTLKDFDRQLISYLKEPSFYSSFKLDKKAILDLGEIINEFQSKKGKVTIIMSPVHAWQIQAIDIANLFNEFKEWKKLYALMASYYDIDVWDFSNYNKFSTEQVSNEMNWYNDSSHYSGNFVTIINKCIIDNECKLNNKEMDLLGKKIFKGNIDDHLRNLHLRHEEYKKSRLNEILYLQELNQKAKNN